jgi:RecG-like helicase/very-short-patch-repair endonuclease
VPAITLSSPLKPILKTTDKHITCLAGMGIETLEDFLQYFPREYEDRTEFTEMANLRADQKNVLLGELSSVRREKTPRGFSLVKAIFTEEKTNTPLECVWFNSRGLEKTLPQKKRVMLVGKAKLAFGKISFSSPSIEIYGGTGKIGNIASIYSEHYFLTPQWFAKKFLENIYPLLARKNESFSLQNVVPTDILSEKNLLSRRDAFLEIHFPSSIERSELARKTFAFEELFVLQIASLRKKEKMQKLGEGKAKKIPLQPQMISDFFATLPFTPTNAQKIALFEILKDFEKDIPMQRLLEGDVGSGKTLVALVACISVILNGGQCALLAPTEILASQHFSGIQKFLTSEKAKIFWEKWRKERVDVPLLEGEAPEEQGEELKSELTMDKEYQRISYNPELTKKAKELRTNATPQENKLWFDYLSQHRLRFLRQRPIDNFIVDFYCSEKKLVIEIDGESHFSKDGLSYDNERTRILESYGLQVVRFTNVEIGENFDGVCETIEQILLKRSSEQLPPSPPLRGGIQNEMFAEEKTFPNIQFFSGSVKGKKREKILEELRAGSIDIIIGTHALLEDPVIFSDLGFVVIDEQHRFGVIQREKLLQKGSPHVLQMSATPIPRTLAIVAFGDQDISVLNELPAGRKTIETKVVSQQERRTVELFVDDQITKGRQAFVICPLVEESEHFDELKSATEEFLRLEEHIFPNRKIALLHGRMKPAEKDQIMNDFKAKKYDILVSTSVVEVGVDVPNSTIMLIEGAERFGLSQLHQFRGRVGRGEHQSYCFLFSTNSKENARLRALEETENGFELAEIDMNLRGSGEIFGLKQSGVPDLKMATLMDGRLVVDARQEAENFLENSSSLSRFTALGTAVKKREKSLLSQ